MKIYVGLNKIQDQSYTVIDDVRGIDYLAEDSEIQNIILDGVLSQHNLDNIIAILNLVFKKTRLNGIVSIKDVDFDLLSFHYSQKNDIIEINSLPVLNNGIKSFINLEYILNLAKNYNFEVINRNYTGVEFVLELRRS